jgi:hypothetical protein
MSKQNPYFSFEGMAFRTTGDDVETDMNIHKAMEILRNFVTEGSGQSEAMQALGYLEDQNPKLERYCDEMRIAFLLDDFDDAEAKKRLAIKAYNGIADRLSGRPAR